MDSDSDSDGSHVSATPPRDPLPPPMRPQQPPPNPPSSKSTAKIKPSSHSDTIFKSKKPSWSKHDKPKPKVVPEPEPKPIQLQDLFYPVGNFPFQIRRPSDQLHQISVGRSLETLPAGSTKTLNKNLPNLIRDAPSPEVKFQRRSEEGNFVKLNFRGYKRKFTAKGKKMNNYSYKSKYFKRSKRRVKPEVDIGNLCDEEAGSNQDGACGKINNASFANWSWEVALLSNSSSGFARGYIGERLLNADLLSIFSDTTSVSLVVVDEAHCVSEWSRNFRPSYMRLRASLLRAKLNAECILAMTATATTTTLSSVMSALEISSTNLIQKAQFDHHRMKDILKLLKSPFVEARSITVYCKFQVRPVFL
ncbi:DEAD/DEAH box RNA helicase family protein isoform 2 [Hibiscus syriacus]|uniref:DEAD/DEAH box RNA helicase family protein isoform 2 n=1 Tax=Hibiscus syriacus TaxID=106335 RepID=A0A6A2Y8C3_HIBSY|nr:DEAD/DEAH box RNA helicase family protein isoform 2 [Hibiscus syriacus]